MKDRMLREEYPKCPYCNGPIAGAMMTQNAIQGPEWEDEQFGDLYYPPPSVSVYCVDSECNWDHLLSDLKTPVPR